MMASPVIVAVEGVVEALRAIVSEGLLTIPDLRIIETYIPHLVREDFEFGITALVYPQSASRNREGQSALFDQYQVDVAIELIASADHHNLLEQQKVLLNHGQTIADQLSKKTAVSLGLMASSNGGMFEELKIDTLDLICIRVSGIYRIMHELP